MTKTITLIQTPTTRSKTTTTVCTPLTCVGRCGTFDNGCGLQIVCGNCNSPQVCGGAGVPNVCSLNQPLCPGPGDTTITGTIFQPNGLTPLANAIVYIPLFSVPAFVPGVSCDTNCIAPLPGTSVTQTTTDLNGTFTLSNVPVASNVPIVFQIGYVGWC